MSAACQCCGDTGSLSKTLEGDLDCVHCDVAGERVNFEAWTAHAQLLDGGVIDAWKLYQMGKSAVLQDTPVAYAVTSDRGGIHKLSITEEAANRKAATWSLEWPNNNCRVRPLIFGDVAINTEKK